MADLLLLVLTLHLLDGEDLDALWLRVFPWLVVEVEPWQLLLKTQERWWVALTRRVLPLEGSGAEREWGRRVAAVQ